MNESLQKKIIIAQRNELTESVIYRELARRTKDSRNRQVLERIAQEEEAHALFWASLSKQEVAPKRLRVVLYVALAKIFGITFGIKFMESKENAAQNVYAAIREVSPQIEQIINDEERHEHELMQLINEERLAYVSSIVLGLNDALVELTGALAGFTLALQNARLIAVVGLITGIAASMSMAASEYLATKHESAAENSAKSPLKASIYTGSAYVVTVIILILPYLLFDDFVVSFLFVVANALAIIFLFTFYVCVAKELSFKKRFFEMAGLSTGIAAVNFLIGLGIRTVFGVDV